MFSCCPTIPYLIFGSQDYLRLPLKYGAYEHHTGVDDSSTYRQRTLLELGSPRFDPQSSIFSLFLHMSIPGFEK